MTYVLMAGRINLGGWNQLPDSGPVSGSHAAAIGDAVTRFEARRRVGRVGPLGRLAADGETKNDCRGDE